MNLEEYLAGVNKTWKKDDGLKELVHCRLALMEEPGEIAGWYKKHLGYGKPKEGKIKTGLKEEFGDLLYYIVKTAEITGLLHQVQEVLSNPDQFEDIKTTQNGFVVLVADITGLGSDLTNLSIHSSGFAEALIEMTQCLLTLIYLEGWDLEEIQYSNLAKLDVRHGGGFEESQALPSNRNKDEENRAIDG